MNSQVCYLSPMLWIEWCFYVSSEETEGYSISLCPFSCWGLNIPRELSQYSVCWCPVSTCRHVTMLSIISYSQNSCFHEEKNHKYMHHFRLRNCRKCKYIFMFSAPLRTPRVIELSWSACSFSGQWPAKRNHRAGIGRTLYWGNGKNQGWESPSQFYLYHWFLDVQHYWVHSVLDITFIIDMCHFRSKNERNLKTLTY